MVTERNEPGHKEGAPAHDEYTPHPELIRALTFVAHLQEEWRPLFDEPLTRAVHSFARLHEEKAACEARRREHDQLLEQAVAQEDSVRAAEAALQHEIATGTSPEHIKERIRQTLAAPHAQNRIAVRLLKRHVGPRSQSISDRLEEARAAVAEAAEIREETQRKHAAEKENITNTQEQLSRRPANIAIQLHTRMEQTAAQNQEIVLAYMRAYPENATRAVHTFAETHVTDPTIIEKYFSDFCLEALHQKGATKRAQAQPLYQRLERKQPGEPLTITHLTRAELTYWINYISYRVLQECWGEEGSPLRTVILEPTVPRLV